MKKLIVLRSLMIAMFAFLGISMISCEIDKYEPVPVKLDDVKGNYKARLVTSQGNKFNEKIIEFTAKDTIITFKDFPVREIVKTVVADPVKADTVLAHIGKIEYKLDYQSKLNVDQNIIELTFQPKDLGFQMTVDGTTKNIVVKLKANQKGFFVGYDSSLRFGFEAEKINIDGVEFSPYQTIKYDIPISVKN
ncbi:MAG: hypothetical protein K0R36_2989 [Chryseobacterium sp.]|nr:hypothetical protein [Chryseobacterium sp.]